MAFEDGNHSRPRSRGRSAELRTALVGVAIVLSLGACSSGAEEHDSARSLAGALADAGYVCSELNVSEDLDKGDSQALQGATCITDEGMLSLRIWESAEKFAEDRALDDAARPELEDDPVLGEVWQVNGPNWLVQHGDKGIVEDIAKKLGGEVQRVY